MMDRIRFEINKDNTIHFVPVNDFYVVVWYYLGYFNGQLRNIRETEPTEENAKKWYNTFKDLEDEQDRR